MSAIRLRSYEFRKEREATWRRLENLVAQVERRGLGALTGEQLAQLPQLYRGTVSALSVARAISLDRNLLDYLENLCARAYLCVYGSRRHARDVVVEFFTQKVPQTIREFRWHIFTAALFLFVGVAAGYLVTMASPEAFHAFVPSQLAGDRGPEASRDELVDSLYGSDEFTSSDLGQFSGQLFSHNASIGILYFALGFAAGIPVFLYVVYNGLILGSFFAVYRVHGLEVDLLAWLMIHGVTELLAILICAAGGLALAHALVFPGRYSRLENLARTGRKAGAMVLMGVLMLFIAGFIEGIARQRITDMGVRFTFAAVTAGIWFAYFVFVGRRRPV
ncbi:MAG: stage II sporulation protein M [Planctomycetota bacterium]|nr:stage II sporulation protein M [Planctomycetota bacterium]